MRAWVGWMLVVSEKQQNAFLCRCDLEECVPERRVKEPPNKALQQTPLCGRKIGRFLEVGNSWSAFPFYRCGAAKRQAVGRPLLYDGMMHRAVSCSHLCQQRKLQEGSRKRECADVVWMSACGRPESAESVPVLA